MSIADSLLSEITAFCAAHGMSKTKFGLLAARDGHLVNQLEKRGSMTLKRLEKVREFMRTYPSNNAPASSVPSNEAKETREVAA